MRRIRRQLAMLMRGIELDVDRLVHPENVFQKSSEKI
jgi:hypothetical protein